MEIRLDWLLAAAWIPATLPILLALIPSPRLSPLHEVVLGFAKRGKILQPASHKFTAPQRFYLHFYLLAAGWTTLLVLITWHYAYKLASWGSDSLDYSTAAVHLTGVSRIFSVHRSHFPTTEQRYKIWVSVFLLLLMDIQVLMRIYETLYVFKYSSSARMHIFGYLAGLFFYTAAPLSLCHSSALEALNFAVDQLAELNVKSHDGDFNWWGYLKPIAKLGWCQWAGAAIFAWGWLHERQCHAILGSLRKHRERTDEYVIPRGDWFEIVSSPHYLAEMIIYAGILVASGGTDFIIWLLLLFVVANLTLAAAETHRWYLLKFEDYPRNRRTIFPFVY